MSNWTVARVRPIEADARIVTTQSSSRIKFHATNQIQGERQTTGSHCICIDQKGRPPQAKAFCTRDTSSTSDATSNNSEGICIREDLVAPSLLQNHPSIALDTDVSERDVGLRRPTADGAGWRADRGGARPEESPRALPTQCRPQRVGPGTAKLRIPKLLKGSYFPSLLEPR